MKAAERAARNYEVNLNLDYLVHTEDRKSAALATNYELTAWMIKMMTNMKWREKMPRADAKIWGAIQDLLVDDPKSIELDNHEFEWLLQHFKDHEFPPSVSSWSIKFSSYLEELKYESEKAEREEKDNRVQLVSAKEA